MRMYAGSVARFAAIRGVTVFVALASASACASRSHEAGLPPVPTRAGPLDIDVVYPPDGSLVAAQDSNFIFGSVGNGHARLTINGYDVSVQPNGAFLAWLPVPGGPGDSLAVYRLTASLGDDTVSAAHSILRPRVPVPLTSDSAAIVVASISPRGSWWVRKGEVIPISVRAAPGATVRLLLPSGDTLRLVPASPEISGTPSVWVFGRIPTALRRSASPRYYGELLASEPLGRGVSIPGLNPVADGAVFDTSYCSTPLEDLPMSGGDAEEVADTASVAGEALSAQEEAVPESPGGMPLISSERPEGCAVIEVATADDTMRVPVPLDVWIQRDQPVIELKEMPSAAGSDGFVVGRAARGATTLWMWVPGMRARVTGRRDDSVRLGLDNQTEAWVALDETIWLDGLTLPERVRMETVRFEGFPDRLRCQVFLSQPAPYQARIEGRRLTLTLYGAYSNTDWLRFGPADEFLKSASWEQVSADRYLLNVELAHRPWGYRVRYDEGSLILDIRKPPVIDRSKPLKGRVIAVDPGHPPAGSVGPTRLHEAQANLAVAVQLKRLLEDAGTTVIMTRTGSDPVRLYDRTRHAELMNAEILVSIHNNALPDGVNPFENNGTSVFYFHPGSLDLARALQSNLLRTMGLRDLGIGRASLALARPTWMPAVLTEGAFMMIPEQEAALRDPAFQEAYARGVLEGLSEFLRERSE